MNDDQIYVSRKIEQFLKISVSMFLGFLSLRLRKVGNITKVTKCGKGEEIEEKEERIKVGRIISLQRIG